jgi:E1A-binding protein p400
MDESQLPAIYVKKEYKRIRTDDGFYIDGRRPMKMRKDDGFIPPRSLFDRPSPAILKMRKDMKQQRSRGLIRANFPMANFKQQISMKPLIEPEGMAEWLIFEDRAILNVIQSLQGLPLNLMQISPGHTPNWDLVSEIVNQTSRTYRSPKQCRWRYEAIILPREEGKLLDSPKKQKKNKALLKTTLKNTKAPRTAQLYQNDNNGSFVKLTKMKFDAIKTAMGKKQPYFKKYTGNTPLNQNHLSVLSELGIVNYDLPSSPLDIAHRCYEKLIQERNMSQQKMEQQVKLLSKPTSQGQLIPDQLSPMHIQQQSSPIPQQASSQQISQQATIVVQQQSGNQQQGQVAMATALVHGSQLQAQRIQAQTINLTPSGSSQQSQQIMKAIVASASPGGGQQTLQTLGIIPQIHINPQSIQNSQSNLIQTSSVSVVLTTPHSTVTSVQPQIVSIQPTVATSTPIVTQTPGSIVQTLNQQGSQVVSVSQLAIGSSSLTANAQGATIATTSQIRQRSVSKEVVFQHRPGQTNPTVISVSGLTGQGITQLQNATLRFTPNYQSNQLRGTTPDQKIVTTTGPKRFEIVNSASQQFHIYGQPVRQKVRFLQTQLTPATQTSGSGSNTGAIGQTVQVQSGGGQKITVATINPSAVSGSSQTQQQGQGTSGQGVDGVDSQTSSNVGQVTVQVGPQQRAQFIKQVSGTTTIGQNTNQKLVVVQRELTQQYKTGQIQLTPQQLTYTPTANLQLQQVSAASGQQITTLIKTTTASGITTVAGTSQLGMKLSPIRTGLNQNQVAQVRQVAIPQTMAVGTIQGTRKPAPKVTRIAQVPKIGISLQQKDEGKYTIQEVKSTKSPSIFLSNQGVIPVSSPGTRETLQVNFSSC